MKRKSDQAAAVMTAEGFRAWRKDLGLKQKDAAERLGLKKRMIQYYEKGNRDGKAVTIPKTVRLACYALSVGIADFDGHIEAVKAPVAAPAAAEPQAEPAPPAAPAAPPKPARRTAAKPAPRAASEPPKPAGVTAATPRRKPATATTKAPARKSAPRTRKPATTKKPTPESQ